MGSEMGGKMGVVFWLCLLGTVAAEVTLKSEWQQNFGWLVTCSWQTLPNDTLQSVRIFRNGIQFLVYRPEINGVKYSEMSRNEAFALMSECRLTSSGGQRGQCEVKMELYQTATEDVYRCETSGERPTFRLEAQETSAVVPPSGAVLKQIETENEQNHILRPTVNCTSSGLPPPRLIWTVEGQKIPEDFTHTIWNSTTKLWDSWSSYNPQKYNVVVACSPEATTKNGTMLRGAPTLRVVTYNAGRIDAPELIVLFLTISALILR